MKLSQQINIAMHPNDAFKVYLYHKDRRITQHIVYPKEGKFKIKGNGYIVNSDRVFFEKKTPTSIYSAQIAEPINPLDINEKSNLSSQDFYNAIEATVVQDIIRAGAKQDNSQMMMMMMMVGIVVVVVAGGIYYLSGILAAQSSQINTLTAALEALKTTIASIPASGGNPGGGW